MHARLFQVLADPTRFQIVEALRKGEQPVSDLIDQVGIHQSGVSRHLRILHEAGFVAVRPDGAMRLYSLQAKPFRDFDIWVNRYRLLWEARLERFASALEANPKERRSKPRGNMS